MLAGWFEKFGSANDVLTVGEFETPVAGPGEVLVRLHTSGVNPSDVKKRAGSFPDLLDGGPVIEVVIDADDESALSVGQRVSGRLVDVGEDGAGQTVVDCFFAPVEAA